VTTPVPPRVRVTAPRAGEPRPGLPPQSSTDDGNVSAEYARSLLRSQLRLGMLCAAGFIAYLVAIPLSFVLVPRLESFLLAGLPLSWWLLGFGVYPIAIAIALIYVRSAARNEARYRALADPE
jgi:putative solute:sodium symporter small subunit